MGVCGCWLNSYRMQEGTRQTTHANTFVALLEILQSKVSCCSVRIPNHCLCILHVNYHTTPKNAFRRQFMLQVNPPLAYFSSSIKHEERFKPHKTVIHSKRIQSLQTEFDVVLLKQYSIASNKDRERGPTDCDDR